MAGDDPGGMWRRGILNGVVLGGLAIAAIVALHLGELPGLGAVLGELPLAVLLSAAVHLPQILLTAQAWRELLPSGTRPGLPAMAVLRWFRESANTLLPAGALVGQAAAARLLARRGVPGRVAGATATVDLSLEAVSQVFFTLAGVLLLLLGASGLGMGASGVAGFALAGVGVLAAGAAAMLLLQRRLGALERVLARLARRFPAIRPAAVRELEAAIVALHADWSRLARATLYHTAAWFLGAAEIAGVLWLLGHPITLSDALVVEALAQALRNVGFMLPGAAAVQEGAIVAAGALVGVLAAPMLAAALVRRAREVAFALPGLVAWHRAELRAHPRPQGPEAGQ